MTLRLAFASADLGECAFGGGPGCCDLGFPAAEPHAAERAERDHLEQMDVRGLLGLVRGDRGVRGGIDLEDVERLVGHDHVAVAHAVDELALVAIDPGDALRGDDLRLEAIFAANAHARHDRVDRGFDLALVAVVNLEHAVRALDDLHAGANGRCLERGVGELVDGDARRDFDEGGRFFLEGHEASADGLQKAGQLGLQRVENGERTKLHRGRTLAWSIAIALAACSDPTPGVPVDAPAVDAVDVGGCPLHMVPVDAFCIDRYEAALEELLDGEWRPASPYSLVGARVVRAVPAAGVPPQGYISGVEAAAACREAGKRLCTTSEWLAACRGPTNTIWPYGNAYAEGACNDRYAGHPVIDFFGMSTGIWDAAHLNDPGINQQPNSLARGGEHAQCVSAYGAFDLHGNLHEWVDDAAGTFRGGFYADGERNGQGCLYVTTAHAFGYHDYSTGFRCCF